MFFLETLVIDHIGDGSPSAVAKVLIEAMGFWDYFWGKVCNARKGGMIWSKPKILSQNCLCHSPERRQECCAKAVSWKLLGDQNYFSLSKLTDNFVSALSSLQGRLFISCVSIPTCSYEYSCMQFPFDLYSREEIEDLYYLLIHIFMKFWI